MNPLKTPLHLRATGNITGNRWFTVRLLSCVGRIAMGIAISGVLLISSCDNKEDPKKENNITVSQVTDGVSQSNLSPGDQNVAMIGLAVSAQEATKLTSLGFKINVTGSASAGTILSNVRLVRSSDKSLATTNDNTFVNSTISGNSISFSLSNEELTTTVRYFFLIGDIGTSSTISNSTLQISISQTNFTVSTGTLKSFSFSGPTFQIAAPPGAVTVIKNTKGIAGVTIATGTKRIALLGLSAVSTQACQLTTLSFQHNSSVAGLFEKATLVKSTDDDFNTSNDNTEISSNGMVTGNSVSFSGLTETLGTAAKHFFLIADIGANPGTLQISLSNTNLVVNQGIVSQFQFTSSSYTISSQKTVADNPNYFYVYGVASTVQGKVVFTPDNNLTSPELRPYNPQWHAADVAGDSKSIHITASGIPFNRNDISYTIRRTTNPTYPNQTDSIKVFEKVKSTDPYTPDTEAKPSATHLDNNYVVIVMDISPSLGNDVAQVKVSAENMAKQIIAASPNAKVAMVAFATDLKTLAFTNKATDVTTFIQSLTTLGDYTALYDAMKTGIMMLNQNTSNFVTGSLVTFTDGRNNSSVSTFDQLSALVQDEAFKKKVTSYTIGYTGKGGVDSDKLAALATHPQFYAEPSTIDAVSNVFKIISDKTSEVYTIFYKRSKTIPEPVFIRIEIRATKKN